MGPGSNPLVNINFPIFSIKLNTKVTFIIISINLLLPGDVAQ